MKIQLSFFCLFSLIIYSCQNNTEISNETEKTEYIQLTSDKYNAVEVNNQVSSIQIGAVAIVDSVFRSDTMSITRKLNDAIFELDVSISRLESLADEHQLTDYFSNSVIDLLDFYKNEFETEFRTLVPLLKKGVLTEGDKNILSKYDLKFVNQEAELFKEIVIRQDSFASFFNIGLSD